MSHESPTCIKKWFYRQSPGRRTTLTASLGGWICLPKDYPHCFCAEAEIRVGAGEAPHTAVEKRRDENSSADSSLRYIPALNGDLPPAWPYTVGHADRFALPQLWKNTGFRD